MTQTHHFTIPTDAPVDLLERTTRPHTVTRLAGYRIFADANGTWLFTPAGSIAETRTPDRDGELTSAFTDVSADSRGLGRNTLTLIPATGWFTVTWVEHDNHPITVTVTTPPVTHHEADRTVHAWTDLRISVAVGRFGQTIVAGLDVFLRAQHEHQISATDAAHATATVEDIKTLLASAEMDGPFGLRGRALLSACLAAHLPPLSFDARPLR